MNVHPIPDNSYIPSRWIQAHAGSGKTYQLVEHIVRLLIEGAEPASILCLTYTNAAAGEMQERLGARLRQLRFMDDAALRSTLTAMTGKPPEAMHVDRARTLMLQLLDAVPGVQFFTLHGFCQSLLSQFPLEAGVPAHFTLLDERVGRGLMIRAYEALLAEAARDDLLREGFSVLQGIAKDGMVEALLMDGLAMRRQWLRLFAGDVSPEDSVQSIGRFFGMDASFDMQARVSAHYNDAWRLKAHEVAQVLLHGKKTDQDAGHALLQWSVHCDIAHWSGYISLFVTDKGEPRKRLYTDAIAKDHPAVAGWLLQERDFALHIAAEIARFSAYALSASMTRLMHRLLALYEQAKTGMRALDYDDLLLKVRGMLADDSLRPWVLFKLDHRLRHLLLDEAQDTSPEQWAIIEALRDELWQGQPDGMRSLLVVGDLKQSIYSFQGAVPRLFIEQQNETAERFHALGTPLVATALDTSRRSAPLIMQLVDTVLHDPLMRSACLSEDTIAGHRTVHEGQPALVSCLPAVHRVAKETVSPFEPVDTYVIQANTRQIWAEALADRIAGWLASGRVLASRGRAVQAGDVLILLQTRSMALPIIRALEQRHVPVAALDRLQLASHLAVRDHLAFFEWALHPYDDYHLAIALRSPLGGLDEDAIFAVAHDRGDLSLWDALHERMPGSDVIGRFSLWRSYVCEMEPSQSLQMMHADGGLRHAYSLRFGQEVLEILDALLGESVTYSETGSTARGFVSWLASHTGKMKREQEQAGGRVRIMTVHGSKGLEAPIVIMADAFDKPSLRKESVVFTGHEGRLIPLLRKGDARGDDRVAAAFERRKEALYEEYYRLLYVALTRAEDEIYIGGIDASGKGEASGDAPSHWYGLVAAAVRAMGGELSDGGELLLEHKAGDGFMPRADKHRRHSADEAELPEWIARPVAAVDARKRVYSPSSLMPHARTHASAAGGRDAAMRGVVYHRILQWMESYRPSDEADLYAWIEREAPHWSTAHKQRALGDIWRLYRDPGFRWLWESPSLREVNIAGTIMPDGRPVAFTGQIDRLVMMDGYRVAVDYKTSASIPEFSDIPVSYIMQMLAYKRLLEADGSGIPVRAALLYTAGPVLYWLDELMENLTFPSLDVA